MMIIIWDSNHGDNGCEKKYFLTWETGRQARVWSCHGGQKNKVIILLVFLSSANTRHIEWVPLDAILYSCVAFTFNFTSPLAFNYLALELWD